VRLHDPAWTEHAKQARLDFRQTRAAAGLPPEDPDDKLDRENRARTRTLIIEKHPDLLSMFDKACAEQFAGRLSEWTERKRREAALEQERRRREIGVNYFLNNPYTSLVKIGKTTYLPGRRCTLESHGGVRLVLLGLVDGGSNEARWHNRFKSQCVFGEWFRLSASDLAEVFPDDPRWKTVEIPRVEIDPKVRAFLDQISEQAA